MVFNSIKSAIPRTWLNKITSSSVTKYMNETPDILLYNGKSLKELKLCRCNFFYDVLVSSKAEDPPACRKWELIYTDFDFNWSEIFLLPYKVARETYLQSFNYKVLNRFIACKSNLHKWNKSPSPSCVDCGELDTVEHHLFECNHLQHFWQQLFNWLSVKTSLRIHLSVTDIIFGIYNDTNDNLLQVYNFCILLAKDYVYNCKINARIVSFKEYTSKLMFRLEIEKHIATSNDKINEFQETWQNVILR